MNNLSNYQVKITGEDGKEYTRTKCEVWTRVMGYSRPISQFNEGKKSEYYSRKYFNERCSGNREFNNNFSI